MKKSLLATVAAVALFAGTGLVAAEGTKEQPTAKPGQAEMNKGADTKGGADVKSKAQTTGSGAEIKADGKAGTDAKSKAQTTGSSADVKANADSKADMKADGKSKPQTTGQSSTDQKSQAQQGKEAPAAKPSAQDSKQTPAGSTAQGQQSQTPRTQSQPSAAQGAQGQSQPTTAQGSQSSTQASAPVNLTPDQKTQIRTSVLQSSSAPKVSRSSINFNISVGTVVPRSIHFVTVPETLVRIHPAWRGYSYFIVDDEIIIVDARTLQIIAILVV